MKPPGSVSLILQVEQHCPHPPPHLPVINVENQKSSTWIGSTRLVNNHLMQENDESPLLMALNRHRKGTWRRRRCAATWDRFILRLLPDVDGRRLQQEAAGEAADATRATAATRAGRCASWACAVGCHGRGALAWGLEEDAIGGSLGARKSPSIPALRLHHRRLLPQHAQLLCLQPPPLHHHRGEAVMALQFWIEVSRQEASAETGAAEDTREKSQREVVCVSAREVNADFRFLGTKTFFLHFSTREGWCLRQSKSITGP
jgi:hypothetical protein